MDGKRRTCAVIVRDVLAATFGQTPSKGYMWPSERAALSGAIDILRAEIASAVKRYDAEINSYKTLLNETREKLAAVEGQRDQWEATARALEDPQRRSVLLADGFEHGDFVEVPRNIDWMATNHERLNE